MRTKVTEAGVLLPKQWFAGVEEVEIRREQDRVIIVPVGVGDPIAELGSQPVTIDVDDASQRPDDYLYGT